MDSSKGQALALFATLAGLTVWGTLNRTEGIRCASKATPISTNNDTVIYDVIVVGLGGHGSSIAAQIAMKGLKVLGVERYTATHSFGSSHGYSRIIRQAYFEDPKYVPLLKRSFELWRQLQSQCPEMGTLLNMTGALMIGKPNTVVIQGTLASLREHNLKHTYLSAAEVRNRFPAFQPSDEEIGLYEDEGGYLIPEKCIEAYLSLAAKHGADLHFEETLCNWQRVANGIKVTTDKGVYFCKKLVLSVGAWAPELYGHLLPTPLHVERRVLYWFEPTVGTTEAFANIPVYIWDTADGNNFYGFPFQPGCDGVKVATHIANQESVRNWTCTPQTIDRNVHDEEIIEIRNRLKDRMPLLPGKLLSTATCMYTVTNDEHFLIDWCPSTDGSKDVLLVSPCSGHGFKFCSVVGEVCTQLVTKGQSELDISLFRLR